MNEPRAAEPAPPPEARAGDDAGPLPFPRAGRVVWALALPILFVEVGETLIYATDTAFLGRVGGRELAAIGLAYSAVELLAVPALALSEAMQVVVARRVGEGRRDAVAPTFGRALLLTLAVTSAVVVAVKLASNQLMPTLVGSGELARAIDGFLQIAAFGLIPMALSFVLSSLFVALGHARALIGATAILVLTNMGGSYLLVLGEAGAPRLGIEGAAYSFVAAELVTVLYLGLQLRRRLELPLARGFRRFGASVARPLVRLSLPIALLFLVTEGRWLAFFVVMERVSPQALSGSSVVYACFAVLVIPAFAFGETAYTLVSNLIGQGRGAAVRGLMGRIVLLAYVVTVPLLVAAIAFPEAALSVFTDDPTAAAQSTLQVAAAALVVVVPAELWLGAVVGSGATAAAFCIELLSSTILIGSAALIGLQFDRDLPYPWVSLAIGGAVMLAASLLFMLRGRWRAMTV